MSKVISLFKKLRTWFWTNVCLNRTKLHGKGIYVNRFCKFSSNTEIGDNCHFNGMRINGDGRVYIGNNFHSGHNILMLTSYHNYDKGDALPYDETFITRDINIEDNVWLGENVIVLAGVTIGEGAVIQAGSVVVSNIRPCAVAGGSPAREFKMRDVEHYYRLKNNT